MLTAPTDASKHGHGLTKKGGKPGAKLANGAATCQKGKEEATEPAAGSHVGRTPTGRKKAHFVIKNKGKERSGGRV